MEQLAGKHILVLGGGFGGLYTALELERRIAAEPGIRVTLVNQDNYFLFTPMLHEVAASDIDLTHIVNPIRKMLRRVQFFQGDVVRVSLDEKTVDVSHGSGGHRHTIPYDHLVIGVGNTTNFYGLPGLEAEALSMKSLGDAIFLRNRLIRTLEEADFECTSQRRPLLSVVVAGGGFAGVETIAGVNDFLREALPYYGNLTEAELRVVLVHAGDAVLPELGSKLGRYAEEKLADRGVEMHLNTRVLGYRDGTVTLSDGTSIEARTLVWTAGTAPHPILASLPCEKVRGRIATDAFLQVPGHPGVWAVGDCAVIPDADGGFYPPTAQHAIREGRVLASNILAELGGRPMQPFVFRTIGQLAAIGRRTGVANILGFQFSGFVAWWLWRTIYLGKLPRFEKKFRVALDWTLDLFFSKDLVQYVTLRSGAGDSERKGEPAGESRRLEGVRS